MKIGNLRYPKVFVFDPSTELIAGNTVKPQDLTLGQVGFFNAKTGVGTTTTPTNVSAPVIEIHQNLGDNKFGTTRTKHISVESVRRWHAVKAAAAVDQITYIGYDEVDGNKSLVAYKGQEAQLNITLFDNDLMRWYGPTGYPHRINLDIARCSPCVADCELLDPDDIADFFVAYINGTNTPSGNFPVTHELQNYLTATKVATGTQGTSDRRVGIKLVGKPKAIELLETCNTQQFAKTQLFTFTVGVPLNCPNFPIATLTKPKAGNGYPKEVAELEMESQGYDRVRNVSEETKYMQSNFIIRAANGVKYDFYYLEFNVKHNDSGIPKEITDPYIVIFAVPTGTGGALQTLINGWLSPIGFTAVTIAASTGKGDGIQQVTA